MVIKLEIEQYKKLVANLTISKNNSFVVIGIPAFNEEKSIANVVLRSKRFADAVVVCDDGSTDMTGEIAQRLGAEVVFHKKNLGYGAALNSLFERSRKLGADVLVTLDGDGQHDPSEVPTIIQPILDQRADIVIGNRFLKTQKGSEMPFYRRIGTRVITKMVNGISDGVSDAQSGFRAYSRVALDNLNLSETGMGASVEIIRVANKKNLKISEVSCSCKYNNVDADTSTKNPVSHGLEVIMTILRMIVEEKPLIMLGFPGIVSLFAGLGFGVWLLKIYASTHEIITNIALASLSFVVIGFFMLSTAITLYAISRLSKRLGERANSA